MKRKPVFLSLLVLLIISCSAFVWMWNTPTLKVENEHGILISIDKLCLDFTNNKKEADSLYLHKAIQLQGQIAELSNNLEGATMLTFAATNNIDDIECTLRDKPQHLKIGNTIIIKGFCAGKTATGISLIDCIIAP